MGMYMSHFGACTHSENHTRGSEQRMQPSWHDVLGMHRKGETGTRAVRLFRRISNCRTISAVLRFFSMTAETSSCR